ncbi:hypothetical protein F2Q70_00028054 [Brassica cretica]|uniref:Uncharacterized protein n=1 Tax=Brassica cretica TaxID=69181 RepID=A0A8S9L8B5_BRACR|nr:hypothetical protein F2Q70_00028054 [Brassica cretica]
MLPSCSSFVVYRRSDCLDPVTVFVFNHLKSSLIPIPLRINLLCRSSARSCINMLRFHICALHAFLISHLAHSQILLIIFLNGYDKGFFFDLKAGQCSSVVEARLLRLWQAKNVKRGGELMWMDLLMVDFNSTMMQVTIGAGRLPHFRDRLHAGTMFFVSGFDVSRSMVHLLGRPLEI